jgi:polysaccharide export outer membrane protein
MPERRRVSLLVIGWAGLCMCLGGLGCHLTIALTENPSAVSPSTPAPDTQPAAQAWDNRSAALSPDRRSPMVLTSATSPGMMPAALPVGPQASTAPGTAGGAYAGTPPPGPVPMVLPPGADGHGGPGGPGDVPGPGRIPTELGKISHPPYMIEPPDILLIDAIRLIPKPPYIVQPLDVLLVRVVGAPREQPVEGQFIVGPDGTITLGGLYGVVRVAGLTLEQVERAIREQVGRVLKAPNLIVTVGLAQFRGIQQVRGQHLVRQDGTISLGTYGCVYVAGLTLPEARVAIERHLSQFVLSPEITVDVFAYNSKVYYIITDGAGYGQQVFRFPITGNETVLDAISNIQGLPPQASKKYIWVARPTPACASCLEILPVDWQAITQGGATGTNYQLFPGDRIYVKADPFICADNTLAKVLAPIERILGVTLLGASTASVIRNINNPSGTTAFIAPVR